MVFLFSACILVESVLQYSHLLTGGDIMGLFGLLGKKKPAANSTGERLDRLTPEGDLPWGWYTANKQFTNQIETEYKHFMAAWLESRKKTDLEQYAALKSFVLYMKDAKALCHSKGECFEYWLEAVFSDDYLAKQTERLKQLEDKIKNS